MQYTYSLILLGTLIGPLFLSFEDKVRFVEKWRFMLVGILVVGSIFIGWDSIFTTNAVWSFNKKYHLNMLIAGLPLEECLFFVIVPFAGVFIYENIRYFNVRFNDLLSTTIYGFLGLLVLTITAINSSKTYTFVNGIAFSAFTMIIISQRYKWLKNSLIAYSIILIPFLIVNGLLTSIPVVLYNPAQNLGIRIYTIPVEDIFYGWTLMLGNIWFYEQFRKYNLIKYAKR